MKLTKEQKREARKERKAKREGLFAEFKKFVMRGNMVDMAVGVMVASAFSKIVTTLTNSIFMPWITWMLSGVSVEDIKTVLKPEELNDAGEVIAAEIAINWGAFIQAIIDFALIAVVLFATLKIVNVIKGRWDYINKQLHKEEIKRQEEEARAAKEKADAEKAAELEKHLAENKVKAENETTNQLLVEIIDLLKK